MKDLDTIRNQFPQTNSTVNGHPLAYFDNAATTLKHQNVIDTIHQHYLNETANVHRGIHTLSEEGTRKCEEARSNIAKFINAEHDDEIIFTSGTTESLNLVAHAWGEENLEAGDVIALSTMEHHSNIVPWQMIADKKQAKIAEIPIDDKGQIDLEAYKKLLSQYNVKLVSVCSISNSLGTINPVKEMGQWAQAHGAVFCIDGAQSIAHTPTDVQALNCDFFAFSGHKMYGPTGIGVLYGKRELLESMPPYKGGGNMIDHVSFEKTTYNDLPHKFEAGTPHIAGIIGLNAATQFLQSKDWNEVVQWENQLLNYGTELIGSIPGVRIIGQADQKSCILSFVVDGIHPHDIGTLLDRQGIAVRTGHHCTQVLMKRFNIPGTIRASFSIYNTMEEVERLNSGLKKALELLGGQ